jgi:hypothetical protein
MCHITENNILNKKIKYKHFNDYNIVNKFLIIETIKCDDFFEVQVKYIYSILYDKII